MKNIKRGFLIFLSVVILWISIGSSYLDANRMTKVEATGLTIVVATTAGEVSWDLLLLVLASIGLGEAAIDNRDALMDFFIDDLNKAAERDKLMKDKAIEIYDSTTGAISSIPWDEFLESLDNYKNSAIDSASGIYAKYSPALVQSIKDFVSSIVNEEIYIEGITELIDSCCDQYDIAAQWSGEMFPYEYNVIVRKSNGILNRYSYKSDTYPYNQPLAFLYDMSSGYFNLYSRSSNNMVPKSFNYKRDKLSNGEWKYDYSSSSSGIIGVMFVPSDSTLISANANFPIFTSKSDMESYLKGTGSVLNALNYSRSISDTIAGNEDLPLWSNYANALWARVADIIIHGNGILGDGAEWDNLPYFNLDAMRDSIDSFPDAVYNIIDNDYPDENRPSYGDAWEQAVSDTWDNVVKKSDDAGPADGNKDNTTEEEEDKNKDKDNPPEGGGGDGGDNNNKDDEKPDPQEPPETGKFTEEEIQEILNDIKGDGYKNNPLRQAYENEVHALKNLGDKLIASGMSLEEVARTLWQARRDLGIQYKDMTPELLREYIYELNFERYGDKLGPTFEYLIEELGKSFQDIIDSASRPNSDIDKLLEGFEEWLRKQ